MDSDKMESPKTSKNFIASTMDLIGNVRIKFIALLFTLFIFLSSDIFVERVLSNFENATESRTVTNYGIILQGIFMVMGYIALEILSDQKII